MHREKFSWDLNLLNFWKITSKVKSFEIVFFLKGFRLAHYSVADDLYFQPIPRRQSTRYTNKAIEMTYWNKLYSSIINRRLLTALYSIVVVSNIHNMYTKQFKTLSNRIKTIFEIIANANLVCLALDVMSFPVSMTVH